jgi:DNA-binding transcriptional ArsR family regulator
MRDLASPFGRTFTATDAEDLAVALKALASPQRLRIMSMLHAQGPLTAAVMQSRLFLSQPTVSHHLRILDQAGVTEWSQDGVFYPRTLVTSRMTELARLLRPGGRR